MRPEKVDRVKKKHQEQKKGVRNREELDEKKEFVSQSRKLDGGEDIADIEHIIISDKNMI